jgi:chaperonin cofactor prefoldin
MANSDVNKVIEEFSHLPPEDKEYVAEIIGKQLIEVKRERLAQRAGEARTNLEKGKVKTGTIKDLLEDFGRD